MLWISHPTPPPVFLITFSYGHICFCIFVAEGFVPPFELKCTWSKIFLALIWKFTTFSIWICGFYKIETFQSVVNAPAMFQFSLGKCLHFTRSQNNHITWLWRSKYLEHMCVMADKGKSSTWATYCAAGNPNMTDCSIKTGMQGISMHYFRRMRLCRTNDPILCRLLERFWP